ncbi:DUF5123 domain-containing protein [Formosa haliotis]|uniref:DUF5123 domain-containing protein n=1 Tax=Formosa haliotis TaxID=1555194 RepID=UPI000A492A26|nr:DUF5123 domain-containing protein [Formosa haliotis]
MNTKYLFKTIFTLVLTAMVISCGYDEELVEDLVTSREFAPVGLNTRVRNQTTVEINWTKSDQIKNYVVEFSVNDPDFNTIYETLNVTPDQLPLQLRLDGETLYYIRVKSLSSRGLDDSTWALTQALTLTEQIMLPAEPGDIKALEATFRWEPNAEVTKLVLEPGSITHAITADEKTAGIATVTGLIPETSYEAILFNDAKIRGSASIVTGIDIGNNTLVTVDDDIFQKIAEAAPGDILLFEKGDYSAQTGLIELNKSITLQGLRADFKPQLKLAFSLLDGATDVSLIDLDLQGDGSGVDSNNDVVRYNAAGNYNSLTIEGCIIRDYNKSFIAGDVANALIQTVTVNNCIVTDVWTNGGDFIDFRNSNVYNVTVTNSTFNNCAPGRDFFRIDETGTTGTGLNCNVIFESNTLYGCSNDSSKRLMYVRFNSNTFTSKNNLITNTVSEGYSDQSKTDPNPTFGNNNYFNADGFWNPEQRVFDATGTKEDPGFTDPSTGNFKVSNQNIIDNSIGDPRWLQ